MGRNKNFLSWLINGDTKRPLYVEKGVVKQCAKFTFLKPDGQPANLEAEPTGWRDTLVKYGRNDKYFGLFRDFTVPLTFGLDAAKIIKSAMWGGNGIEANVIFAISKLDRYQTLTQYKPWYSGEIDFSKLKQKKDTVTVNVMEGGMTKYLKAFENTVFEIPIATNPLAVNVYMDGLPFTNKVEYTIFEQPQTTSQTVNVGMGIIASEGVTQGIIAQDQEYRSSPPGFPNDLYFLYDANKSITANVSGVININRLTAGSQSTRIRIRNHNDNTGATTDYAIVSTYTTPGTYSYPFSFSIPMGGANKLYLQYDDATNHGLTYYVTGGSLILKYDVTFTPLTVIKALRGQDVLAQLASKMSKGLFQSQSNFLTNRNDIVFTSGTAIRGNADSTLKISFEEFYKACKPFFTGVAVKNNMLILEDLASFFQNTIILNVGDVANMEVDIADDKIYNTIKVGYKNNTYDNLNGTDEFNVTQQYTTGVTKVVKELDLTSSVRADMIGVELTRLNLTGKTTTDSKADNDGFILNINTTPETILGIAKVYRLYRKAYTTITGLLHPLQAFNIEFSPKRILKNWQLYLNSIYDLQAGMKVVFQSGEKNSELSTTTPTETITEKADLSIYGQKLFLPYYFTFQTETPFNYLEVMNTNPYGLIQFTYRGNSYTGFMVDGGIKGATNDRQQWKLLAGPDNDMTKLI